MIINIKECDKVKLKTGELAKISEVLKEGNDYIVEIFRANGHVEVDQISYNDISSVFIEVEHPLAR